jgi:hypothetical protein
VSPENETSSLAARLAEQSNRRRVLGIAAGLLSGSS